MNRPDKKTLLTIVFTLLTWAWIGWIMISLRNSTGEAQLATSTLMLRILCAGSSLLLLLACSVFAIGLLQVARAAESEHRFPPQAAPQFKALGEFSGEQAWMIAARLRGWAALTIAVGLIIAGTGLVIATRSSNAPPQLLPRVNPIISDPALVADRQSTPAPLPVRSTVAPG